MNTMLDLDPGAEALEHTMVTLRCSRTSQEGSMWAEKLMSQARTCSNDCARFMAGLEAE